MAGTIAINSQKGGIGKTTTAANLALAWGDVGDRVLLVDLDPQFALTRRFGLNAAEVPGTVYDLLVGDERLADSLALVHPRVELLAARRELARLELTLVPNGSGDDPIRARSARRTRGTAPA